MSAPTIGELIAKHNELLAYVEGEDEAYGARMKPYKDGINAIKRAWDAIKANLLGSILCALVLGIVGSIGSILCGIGVILTLPIAFIGMYHMAKQLTDGGATPTAITFG